MERSENPAQFRLQRVHRHIKLYFHQAKEDVTLCNNKGFTLIEVLIAFSIVVVVTTTVIPMTTLLSYEREILHDRLKISLVLQEHLQSIIREDNDQTPPVTYEETIQTKRVQFNFSQKNKLIKGCVTWKNVQERTEKICLHGYKPS